MKTRNVLMLGTAIGDRGGIGSVVSILRDNGLFERNRITYLATHREGGVARKLAAAVSAWWVCVGRLVSGQVSCLHVHLASRASFWRKLLFVAPAFALRVPVILHLHGGEFHLFYGKESGAVARACIRRVFEGAAAVIVLSESWADWVRSTFPGANAVVIYNPVSISERPAAERDTEAVLFLGRLGKGKGVGVLLEAASLLAAGGVPFKLWLGGDGDIEVFRTQAADLGIADQVEFCGWVSGERKSLLLDTAGLYCLPSFNEGLPISVLEAMAAGMAVVTTPVGGIPEVISDGIEGFLVPPGDARALAERLERLIRCPREAKRMGDMGRQKVLEKFAANVIVPKIEALYGTCRR